MTDALVHSLTSALGPTLVSLIAGASDHEAAAKWASGERPVPNESQKRLEAAARALRLIGEAHGEEAARHWFIAASPLLGGDAPVECLREGRVYEAARAAEAFAAWRGTEQL